MMPNAPTINVIGDAPPSEAALRALARLLLADAAEDKSDKDKEQQTEET